jgi:hypothetical protein
MPMTTAHHHRRTQWIARAALALWFYGGVYSATAGAPSHDTRPEMTTNAAPAPADCVDADFLIGEWDVLRDGKVTNGSKFEAVNRHCALVWTWTMVGGDRVTVTFMAYDVGARNWELLVSWAGGRRQRYVNGTFSRNVMHDGVEATELRFETTGRDGQPQHFSIFAMPDGTIREWEETSADGGKSWKQDYDLVWRRKS